MENTCENCGYAVGWVNNKPIMMCDYYRGTVDGRTCYHWKAKDEERLDSIKIENKDVRKLPDGGVEIKCKLADGERPAWFKNMLSDKEKTEKEYDPVNSSKYYTSGKVECIDAMIEKFGVEAVQYFCLCNAFKYHWRGDQDIKKAMWYMDKYKELENR